MKDLGVLKKNTTIKNKTILFKNKTKKIEKFLIKFSILNNLFEFKLLLLHKPLNYRLVTIVNL